ncbi:MAG: PAS domain S-box protein [Flavobacteriales bacterium]|nr:PAS domain S-box protein [Flavobacteriales bacterium]
MQVDAGAELAKAYLELKRQYDDLVSRNLAGVFRTTIDGRFLECNDAMAMILGFANRKELLGHSAHELYHSPEERDHFIRNLSKEKRLINFEVRLKHNSGREVYVLENVFLDEGAGRVATVQGTLIDITSIRHAQAEQQALMASYKSLVERIRDGLILVADGRVRYANPAAEQMLGGPVLGRELVPLFHPDDHGAVKSAIALVGPTDAAVRARPFLQPERELLFSCGPSMHDGVAAVQVTLQDHTAQQHLIRERVRLQMAEEVNQVLREEIAEHRRTQEALRRSRRFARNLIDSSLDMIMAADSEGLITEYNPAATLRFGFEAEEVIGTDTRKLYADPTEYARVQVELETHGVYTGEVRNVDKFGNEFTSFLAASRLFDESGTPIGAMGVSRDITRMKRDQEALRASEERYRDLFENATDLIQSVDTEGRFEYVNDAWRRTLGYTAEEVAELSISDVVHPKEAAACKAYFSQVLEGKDPGPIRTLFRAKDGRAIAVEGAANLRRSEGKPAATRSILRDISLVVDTRKRIEEHEAKLRALFESSEHMFWTVDPEVRLTSYNKGYSDMIERLHGVRPEISTDPTRPKQRFASGDYHDFWTRKYAEAFSGKPIRFETDLLDKNGHRVCNEVFLSPVLNADGRVTEVFGVGHEITEQKEAEDTVRAQAARLKAIFESSANMMIWTLDKEMRITSCNEHFLSSIESVHGIAFKVGDHFADRMAARVAPERAKELLLHYANALRGRPQQFEVELIDLHGQPAWVENFLNPIIVNGRVQEISCLAYGITDRVRSQRELEQSLSEKEVLLKEVHHRVKNNLQVISSIMNLQSGKVDDDPRLKEILHHSRDRIRSMSLIHESLYQTKQFSLIDMNSYIDGLARNLVMSYSLSGRIELELDIPQERVYLVLDQAIPCGLILNELISNALKHAYPDDGGGKVRVGLAASEGEVRIRVADDGVGMDAAAEARRENSLGLELVSMLTGQLDGRIDRGGPPGVTYLLTFERLKNNIGHGADERPRGGG